ncbi:MAG: thioredoxin family protein [Elusimicrobiota bacterium]|jgi:thiol-disulfide isomerase/thioredoxin
MNKATCLALGVLFAAASVSCKKEEAKSAAPAEPAPATALVLPPPAKAGLIASALPEVEGLASPEVAGSALPVLVYCYSDSSPRDKAFMPTMEAVREKFQGKANVFRLEVDAAKARGALPKGTGRTPFVFFIKDKARKGSPVVRGTGMEPAMELWLAGRPMDLVLAEIKPLPEPDLKEIVDSAPAAALGAKGPVMIYYYANWSPHDRQLMGVVEEIAGRYRGRVKFFRVNVSAAMEAKTLPPDVVAFPYMVFLRPGKERQTKLARPGEATKEIEFFIEEWLSD